MDIERYATVGHKRAKGRGLTSVQVADFNRDQMEELCQVSLVSGQYPPDYRWVPTRSKIYDLLRKDELFNDRTPKTLSEIIASTPPDDGTRLIVMTQEDYAALVMAKIEGVTR